METPTDPTDPTPLADAPDPRQGRRPLDFLGISLVLLRLFRNLSQAELAERAGIRSNQISRYETQQVLPQLHQLQRLADALEIDLIAFFSFVGRVRSLGLSVDATEGLSGRLAAEVHQLFYEADGLQLVLGERLHQLLTEGLETGRWRAMTGAITPDARNEPGGTP